MLNERGAVAVTVALCLVLFCGMAALAVDLGFGFRERRFDQSGADSAALGGSLELVITNESNPVRAGLQQIYDLVDQNLGRLVPYANWAACTDPGALTWQTLSDGAALGTSDIGTDCVSMSSNFNTVRVLVPIQEVPTSFGRVIGFNSIGVNAFAEAERNTDWGGGGDFPSGILSGTNIGESICIKTGNNSAAHMSCSGSTTGDFGNFRPFFYSSVDGDISALCRKGESPPEMARAMADGIDHEFSAYNLLAAVERMNGQWCLTSGVPGPPFPNTVESAAGYQNSDITMGLVTEGDWPTYFMGRLRRGPFVDGSAEVYLFDIDNRPLWDYIDDGMSMTGAPACEAARNWPAQVTLATLAPAQADVIACLVEADAIGLRPFTSEILDTHRIAHSPLYHETAMAGNNHDPYHIKGLLPVFIDQLWANAQHAGFQCEGEFDDTVTDLCKHSPGLPGYMHVNASGKRKIDSASAIVLSCAIMPSGTCPTIQDGTNPLNFLYDLELTR